MEFKKNMSIKELNSFNIDVKCKLFCKIISSNNIIQLLKSEEFHKHKSILIGGGSNILFTKDFNGLLIQNNIKGISEISETNLYKTIKVGAGENWHEFVLWSIKNNLSGIENLSLIPGNVGSSPIQNIGAYGVEVKSIVDKVWAIDILKKKEVIFSNRECQFDYRSSIFKTKLKDKIIITHVSFNLSKEPNHNISYNDIEKELKAQKLDISTKNISSAIIKIRKRKLPDPSKLGNAGSFFKNPIISKLKFKELQIKFPEIVGYQSSKNEMKIAAAWLIESCGWKGFRKGDIGVHKNQALVLVNYGDGKGEEIVSLARDIKESVKKKFDITLVPEVNII